MLKCPGCGRAGGPFRLRHQVQADGQTLRAWVCPCGDSFHATAGAERAAEAQPPYTGFTMTWGGRPVAIALKQITKHETLWAVGAWHVVVNGPPSGPGTRVITLNAVDERPLGEWRLEPGWGSGEITRRIKAKPPTENVDPEFLAHLFVRLLT